VADGFELFRIGQVFVGLNGRFYGSKVGGGEADHPVQWHPGLLTAPQRNEHAIENDERFVSGLFKEPNECQRFDLIFVVVRVLFLNLGGQRLFVVVNPLFDRFHPADGANSG